LEREQKRRRKIERKKETRERSSETGAKISIAMTFSMVEKARNASLAGNNRAHSNGRSGKNEYSSG